MTTRRAKRLEKYLSQHGWDTGAGYLECRPCNYATPNRERFCNRCGKRLTKATKHSALADLENAIAFALEEK